ncbi:MAG: hypothetical protein K2O32_10605 [Acetatifactor sp.]|nr:hypothetical protein [Acetatifactor sp.]
MEYIQLDFETFAEVNSNIGIGISTEYNAIFRADLNTGNCEYLGFIPNEKMSQNRLYTKAVVCSDKIYLVPSSANEIAVIDTSSYEVEKLSIASPVLSDNTYYKNGAKFNEAIVYKNSVYMIGCTYPGILKISQVNGEYDIKYFDSWAQGQSFIFRRSPAKYGNMLYIPDTCDNKVLEFNMDNGDGKFWHIGDNNHGCWSGCIVGDHLWLAPKNPGPVIRWNLLSHEVQEYDAFPKGFCGRDFAFSKIFCRGKNLYLIPVRANMGIIVDTESGVLSQWETLNVKDDETLGFMFEDTHKAYLRLRSNARKSYFYLDYTSMKIRPFEFLLTQGKEMFFSDQIQQSNAMKENSLFQLKDFLEHIAMREQRRQNK